MAYPTATTTFPTATGSEVLNVLGAGTGLAPYLNLLGVDLTAVENKVGIGATTPSANTVLFGTGAGTSAWQGLTSAQLASVVSDETGSGSLVFANTPTIVTPTIASFTNAQHNHSNAAGGGTLAIALNTSTLSNPYKFSAYRSAAQNSGNGAFAIINFDTELFDTNNNFDVTTNVGRYTAPVAGFYQFNARYSSSCGNGQTLMALYKNGSVIHRGSHVITIGTNTYGCNISALVTSAANDYWEVFSFGTGGAMEVGNSVSSWFNGYLVSQT